MQDSTPATKTIEVSSLERCVRDLVDAVTRGGPRIVVADRGRPIAAIISGDDLAEFSALEAERRRDYEALTAIGQHFAEVPVEELEAEVARALAEVRADNREAHERRSRSM